MVDCNLYVRYIVHAHTHRVVNSNKKMWLAVILVSREFKNIKFKYVETMA
jgi:hypothetical protein